MAYDVNFVHIKLYHMHLFDNGDNQFVLCTSYEEEIPGDPETDYAYQDAEVFYERPTRQQAQMFYDFFIPALRRKTGTLISGRMQETEFTV